MQKDENRSRMDAVWLIAFLLLGGFFIYAVIQFPSVRVIACKPAEQDCFRQWVGALSGWGAVLAAIVTVKTMLTQNRIAERQFRNAIVNESTASAVIIKHALAALRSGQDSLDFYSAKIKEVEKSDADGDDLSALVACFSNLAGDMEKVFSQNYLQEYEGKFGPSNITTRRIQAENSAVLTHLNDFWEIERVLQEGVIARCRQHSNMLHLYILFFNRSVSESLENLRTMTVDQF